MEIIIFNINNKINRKYSKITKEIINNNSCWHLINKQKIKSNLYNKRTLLKVHRHLLLLLNLTI